MICLRRSSRASSALSAVGLFVEGEDLAVAWWATKKRSEPAGWATSSGSKSLIFRKRVLGPICRRRLRRADDLRRGPRHPPCRGRSPCACRLGGYRWSQCEGARRRGGEMHGGCLGGGGIRPIITRRAPRATSWVGVSTSREVECQRAVSAVFSTATGSRHNPQVPQIGGSSTARTARGVFPGYRTIGADFPNNPSCRSECRILHENLEKSSLFRILRPGPAACG